MTSVTGSDNRLEEEGARHLACVLCRLPQLVHLDLGRVPSAPYPPISIPFCPSIPSSSPTVNSTSTTHIIASPQ